ncbi:hypothetical protein MUN82_08965 [Hymenobacter aerilatus]|uniref:Uncharacterized protein n=1 Tax=Hymenobacter aerilatus TaxID=2932251 RepID=A0A8T9T210_9BACT|nr:hypothetical protein [Hymenobacter aerilatus]UOR07214.1 hypothetical protein MUN82_08965 [Hymenobacter aerilatus]
MNNFLTPSQHPGIPATSFFEMHGIPAKPQGVVNPAEVPLAKAVLTTSQADLIPEPALPKLYRRLEPQYPTLAEEIWDLLFGEAEPEPECKVIQLQVA